MKTNPRKDNISINRGLKTTLVGIIASALLAAIKIFTGIVGNSYALIADGIESLTDIFTSSIVLTGLYFASKPADENHPYGHGKAEPFAGVAVSLGIFVAAIIIIVQSLYEIITPHHAPASFTLIVLVLVIVIKESLFRFVIKVGTSVNSIAVKSDAWHHRSDAITSAAAFIGISIALIGGEGYESADDFAALFASVIIIINAYRIFKPALFELLDTAPPTQVVQKVRGVAGKVENVMGIDKCFVRKMGFDYFVDIHVLVDANLPVFKGHEIAHKVKDELMKEYSNISDVLVHIEPFFIRT
ncbi:MAG: cation diffusion facilitator family transporter [Ignavibacteriaceae bacterium]|nr:cation diffusion facilitator family transporter [Ignavibacteriaceae bacterium]MCU0364385.1 cation diffusion facilitator family transporter [Ignavibacteriaceae bacterium]MCU0406300.1 cation diffusion facilitator family transporter [Ignavibacteriaceae bacterium]MCU0414667.1 cation diffusion facilitator family transporter [Ignavibacteriaceae bacterium]